MSLNIPLPTVPGRNRVPAHVATPEAAGGSRAGDAGAQATPRFRGDVAYAHADAPAGADDPRFRGDVQGCGPTSATARGLAGASPVCRAPFDPADVPPDALPLWTALRDVMDPELPISVVDMGLIYDVRLAGRTAEVTLTYTATGCPCVDFIRTDIIERLLEESGVDAVTLHEVWSPPWTRAMMTEDGRAALRALGVAT